MSVLRGPLMWLARNERVKDLATTMPVTSSVVAGYVPGESTTEVVDAVAACEADGLLTTIDFLGEDTVEAAQAQATVDAYVELLEQLAARGLARGAEVSVKLTALGLALPASEAPQGGHRTALENARTICRAARNAGTQVTVDMEDHTTTDATLAVLRELRKDFPETGAVLQAYLRRTEADCRALAHEGSRVRLCKGAYDEPASVAFTDKLEVDRSYVRCMRVLMAGDGYPMLATHDPRMIEIARSVAGRYQRRPGTYEFQMLYGIRPEEQKRLAAEGETMRVYIPYGSEWYGYLVRRLAERPQNLSFFVRSLVSKK
ncbi:proline dehydrogenase family protein [Nocardioides sp. CFH 31398]|uniref:proline dehydrogenase family protein n=1 Tax=Nocardioides sp. CFH 31398 TaxID=2919579 RepID=UPI001F06A362|nr:proline dehydrogenase family protein [Nocardioides sp. CFH 31398]MCH1865132.1 proline dehydrogenase family protein [Nocardioides sp. CFH 31398]